MATCGPDGVCLLCEKSIPFTVHDLARVTQKGLDATNEYSVKYNELNQVNLIAIDAFANNDNKYVHVRCRKAIITDIMSKCSDANMCLSQPIKSDLMLKQFFSY